ncbi:MAG: glycerophosphodiester phosphodiesterase [Cyclobacteriaceae bacterium]|nr:glycerophosphodiester phosphodiesterase [Cyclobacteriaceae bacterium]
MTKRNFFGLIFILLMLAGSCIRENNAFIPFLPNSILKDGDRMPVASRPYMEGVYAITKGSNLFGPFAVLKWHGNDFSLFSEVQGCYFVMKAAHLDSVIFMEGYWRYSSNNKTGLISLRISKNNGAKDILNKVQGNPMITGAYGEGPSLPSTEIQMEYVRPFSEKIKTSDFYVMAHRSGGRNSDNLPHSENSIDMIRYTRNFGTTGIEIDIRLTKDKVPVIYHDEDLNIRSTTKGPLIGAVEEYTFDQISTYVRLLHGEKIPTLEEALTFVVDSTELRAVWLDMKDNPNALKAVIPLQQSALARARAANRNVEIWIGLPTDEMINEFLAYPNHENIPALCELTLEQVRNTNAKVWSPRWTLGTQVENVELMHSEGRKVFCWTIDDQKFMKQFITEGNFDGLLSNYSAMTAYYFYIQE